MMSVTAVSKQASTGAVSELQSIKKHLQALLLVHPISIDVSVMCMHVTAGILQSQHHSNSVNCSKDHAAVDSESCLEEAEQQWYMLAASQSICFGTLLKSPNWGNIC